MAFVPARGLSLVPDDGLYLEDPGPRARRRVQRHIRNVTELPCAGSIVSTECFATAVASILTPLRSYTRRLTREDGDDLLQDTLARAWAARARYEPGTNFKAWLFRIARNHFLSGLRRSARSVQWNADLHDSLLVSAPVQDEGLHRRDFDRALAGLPPAQREALLLIGEEGLSYEEAALHAGEAIGTMKSRVSRGRAAVIAHFAGESLHRSGERPVSEAPPTSQLYRRWRQAGSGTIG